MKKDLKAEYNSIVKQDKGKTYLDILPPDLINKKRSIIKRYILQAVDSAHEFLNSCSFYDGRVFDKKEIVRYMIFRTTRQYELALEFIPHVGYIGLKLQGKEFDSDELFKLERALSFTQQAYESFISRQKIKNGNLDNDYDMEKDGYPRTGRGACCYLFVPVKGVFPENKTGSWAFLNPRNNKEVTYTITGYKAEDKIYKCLSDKGKEVFLMEHDEVTNAYDALFNINKEIFSGWWNRTLISKL